MDFNKLSDSIVTLLGGKENIDSLSHSATRLRFILKDDSKTDLDKIKDLKGVLGATFGAGQAQIIMGGAVLESFDAVQKNYGPFGSDDSPEPEKKKTKRNIKSLGSDIVNFISGSVSAVITGLIAGGMVKLALFLIELWIPSLANNGTIKLLTIVSDVPFYFMPLFVAYGASKKLSMQPVYPLIVAAALLHPDFTKIVAGAGQIKMFGIPVLLVNYSSTMLPALLSTVAVFYIEKFYNKVIPGILKTVFVGALTIVTGIFFTYTILGPAGTYVGYGVVKAIVWLQATVGPISLGILAGVFPFLVMMGMHTLFAPIILQNFSTLGYDPLVKPALLLHVIAEGGMALGVALRAKDKDIKANAFSIGITSIFAGISEPAVYGIALKYKRPIIGVVSGGFAGGVVAGLFNVKTYMMTKTTILSLPVYKNTIIGMALACMTALVVSFVVAYVVGIDEPKTKNNDTKIDNKSIYAPVSGQSIALEQVNDDVFSKKMLGNGLAFKLSDKTVVSPFAGKVSAVFPTSHAIGLTSKSGVETLIHVGLDTVSLNGKGFKCLVKMNQEIKVGQQLIELDLPLLKSTGLDLTTMLVFTNLNNNHLEIKDYGKVIAGKSMVAKLDSTEESEIKTNVVEGASYE